MRRREFLAMAGATAVTGFSIPRATAQVANWPDRSVKVVIPYAPGGGSDLIGRPWAEALSQAFGQQFVVRRLRTFAQQALVECDAEAVVHKDCSVGQHTR